MYNVADVAPPKWRWLLVPHISISGVVLVDWIAQMGIIGTGGEWVVFAFSGFAPVSVVGKIAPSRQLAIAMESALLLTFWIVSVMFIAATFWRAGEHSGTDTGYILAYLFVSVAGAISAVWVVRRKRTRPVAGDLPWAVGAGIVILLAFLGYILGGAPMCCSLHPGLWGL